MSFGFSIGDFVAVGQLCWTVYLRCKNAPGQYTELSLEVSGLYTVIEETRELFSRQKLSSEQQRKLSTCREGCEKVLQDLGALLSKYESLGTKSRRTFDRMGFGGEDMKDIRLRLISNVTMLDAFNNMYSHTKLEKKLNLLIQEIRSGQRESSVVSIQTIDSITRNDTETWEALQRDLEDVGISPTVIRAKRDFIVEWFKVAVAAGQLEEDLPADLGCNPSQEMSDLRRERERTISSDNSAGSRSISKRRSRSELTTEAPANGTSRITPQGGPGSRFTEVSSTPASAHTAQRPPSSFGLSYLMDVLRGSSIKDANARQQLRSFHNAVVQQNITLVRQYLDTGINVDATFHGKTALDSAIDADDTAMAKLLLERGANPNQEFILADGRYPLTDATRRSDARMVKLLIDGRLDININVRDGHVRGKTALMIARRQKDTRMVALLINARSDFDVDVQDEYGETALIIATRIAYVIGVKMPLEKGADTRFRSLKPIPFGQTALDIAQTGLTTPDKSEFIELLRNAEALANGNVESTSESGPVDSHP